MALLSVIDFFLVSWSNQIGGFWSTGVSSLSLILDILWWNGTNRWHQQMVIDLLFFQQSKVGYGQKSARQPFSTIASDFSTIASDCRKSRVCFSSPASAVTSPTLLYNLPSRALLYYQPSVSSFSVSHLFHIFLCFTCPPLPVICFSFLSSRYHFLVISNPFCSSCWQLQKSRTEEINIFNWRGVKGVKGVKGDNDTDDVKVVLMIMPPCLP